MGRVVKFSDRDALATDLANEISERLSHAISQKGKASIALSGGSTPTLLFQKLSQIELDWNKIFITLVDDRQVTISSDRSNAKLLRDNLLQKYATSANFISLYEENDNANERVVAACNRIEPLLPLDVCLLGMGLDGHTASFFPNGDNLASALDLGETNTAIICTMEAPNANEPRLTLTLSAILKSSFIALHIEGDEKMKVYECALENLSNDSILDMPIRGVIKEHPVLSVYWAA